ncbi:MAG: universal stress protein [Candidatus Sulfotelmatobacter sp.]
MASGANFQKVLIAVDGYPVAAHAADVGAQLARSLGAEVALLYTVDPSIARGNQSGVPGSELVAQAEVDAKRLLATFRERLALRPPALEFLQVGKPATEIVKAAKEWPADLIVIGSHGRRGVERVLLGSVAEAVLRHAPCPVLVVRAPE